MKIKKFLIQAMYLILSIFASYAICGFINGLFNLEIDNPIILTLSFWWTRYYELKDKK